MSAQAQADEAAREAAFEADLRALATLLGAKRYEVTDLELEIWAGIIRHPGLKPGQFRAFLIHHVTSSTFAPQPNEAMEALGLRLSAEGAFRELVRLVREHGPWVAPEGVDAALVAAVHTLGGWEKVNNLMPDPDLPGNSYAVKQFRDEFDVAFKNAQNAVNVRGLSPPPLAAIGQPAAQPLLSHSRTERLAQ